MRKRPSGADVAPRSERFEHAPGCARRPDRPARPHRGSARRPGRRAECRSAPSDDVVGRHRRHGAGGDRRTRTGHRRKRLTGGGPPRPRPPTPPARRRGAARSRWPIHRNSHHSLAALIRRCRRRRRRGCRVRHPTSGADGERLRLRQRMAAVARIAGAGELGREVDVHRSPGSAWATWSPRGSAPPSVQRTSSRTGGREASSSRRSVGGRDQRRHGRLSAMPPRRRSRRAGRLTSVKPPRPCGWRRSTSGSRRRSRRPSGVTRRGWRAAR